MFLTEEEAKKKWCPFATNDGRRMWTPNSYEFIPATSNCLATGCTLWRAEPHNEKYVRKGEELSFDHTGWTLRHDGKEGSLWYKPTGRGFCSLGQQKIPT